MNISDLVLVAGHFGKRTNAALVGVPQSAIQPDADALQRLQVALNMLELVPHPPAEIRRVSSLLRTWVTNYHTARVSQTRLFESYPNPFNPETWMPFQLSHTADVTIRIYDVTGKQLRQLDLGHLSPGAYVTPQQSAYWDGHDDQSNPAASGLYFYTLRTGRFQSTQPMLLLK